MKKAFFWVRFLVLSAIVGAAGNVLAKERKHSEKFDVLSLVDKKEIATDSHDCIGN